MKLKEKTQEQLVAEAFAIFNGDLNSTEHLINCLYIGIPMGY